MYSSKKEACVCVSTFSSLPSQDSSHPLSVCPQQFNTISSPFLILNNELNT